MSVPSSGSTFSTASESVRNPTPSSSQDDGGNESVLSFQQASSVPRSLPTAQPPLFLFQDLQLGQTPSKTTSRRSSPSSRLSPGCSQFTYADQHNASPSPRPRPIHPCRPRRNIQESASRSYNISQAGRGSNNSGPQSVPASLNTEDVQIPGAFPVGSGNASEAGTSQDDSGETEIISNDIRDEALPPAPIYNGRLQDGLKAVKHQLASLANTMHVSELTQDQSTSLHTLWKRTEKMSKFEYPETRTVGFIGDSGVGMGFSASSHLFDSFV